MSGPIKDFVVRGRDANGRRVYAYPDEENGYEPKRGTGKLLISSEDAACFARLELQAAGCSDVAIFRVLDGGREERLPSYEEALGEIAAAHAQLDKGGALTHMIGTGSIENQQATLAERINDALAPDDPLAALEAAERRLLEASGWTRADYGGRWKHEQHGTTDGREGARLGEVLRAARRERWCVMRLVDVGKNLENRDRAWSRLVKAVANLREASACVVADRGTCVPADVPAERAEVGAAEAALRALGVSAEFLDEVP